MSAKVGDQRGRVLKKTAIVLLGIFLFMWTWGVIEIGFVKSGRCSSHSGFVQKLICGSKGTYNVLGSFIRNVPSDEDMITHFHNYRADFERLVKIYREDLSVPVVGTYLSNSPEVAYLKKRTGMRYIHGDQGIWIPPDPYAKQAYLMIDKFKINPYSPKGRQYSGVVFDYDHLDVFSFNKYQFLIKKYYFVPFIPKVVQGELSIPGPGFSCKLVKSLNDGLADMADYECACRQFEAQWLIMMCGGEMNAL